MASNALMFCILMSGAEIQPLSLETVGNWAGVAFIASSEDMMYLFLEGEAVQRCLKNSIQMRPTETTGSARQVQVIFLKVGGKSN